MDQTEVERLRAELARLTAELDDERRVSAARLDEVANLRREVSAEFDQLNTTLRLQQAQARTELAGAQQQARERLEDERRRLVARYEQSTTWKVGRRVQQLLLPVAGPARRLLGRSGGRSARRG